MEEEVGADLLGTSRFIQLLEDTVAGSASAEAMLEDLREVARPFYERQKASATVTTYKSRLRQYHEWCRNVSLPPLRDDPEQAAGQIALFIIWLAQNGKIGRPTDEPLKGDRGEYAINTMRGFLTAISTEYRNQRLPDPTNATPVENAMAAYSRIFGKPEVQAHALTLEQLGVMCVVLEMERKVSYRDRLLLLLLSDPRCEIPRSKIVRLSWTDVASTEDGLVIVAGGKTYMLPQDDERDLDITMAFQAWSMDAAASGDYVFPGGVQGKPLTAERARVLLNDVARRADVSFIPGTKRGFYKLAAADRKAMLDAMKGPAARAVRERALLTTGWWGQLRASELSGLLWGGVTVTPTTVALHLTRGTKGDQYRAGERVEVERNGGPTDPGTALLAWKATLERLLGRSLGPEDPVLWALHTNTPTCNERTDEATGKNYLEGMTTEAVNEAVQWAAERADIKPDPGRRLTSHTMRAGGATEQLLAGHPTAIVAEFGRRKSEDSLQRYFRAAKSAPGANPTSGLVNRRYEQYQEHLDRRVGPIAPDEEPDRSDLS